MQRHDGQHLQVAKASEQAFWGFDSRAERKTHGKRPLFKAKFADKLTFRWLLDF
jgi:hypothetical protein